MDLDQVVGGSRIGGGFSLGSITGFHPFAILFIIIACILLASGANSWGAVNTTTGQPSYVSSGVKIVIAAGLGYLGYTMMVG